MKMFTHAFSSLCFVLIGVLLGFLGVIDDEILSGAVAFITCLVIAYALFHKAERLAMEERVSRRLFKGNLN